MSNQLQKPRSLRRANGVGASLCAAALLPLSAAAQTEPTITLPTVTVQEQAIDPNPNAEVGAPYKAKTSADTRYTRPLAEIPQSISVITKSAIDDLGATDLKQILATQPGITLGTGENGNAFGDRYIIRGQEAKSDVFVDGLRDPGMTIRESFAIEQVEITKGPNSSFAGRGSAGGAVNAVTKQATLDYDFTRLSLGAGTDDHHRVTVDMNKAFGDKFALRANALTAGEDVPDRSPSARRRDGLALSGLWEVNSDLSVTLDYYGMRGKDKRPDLGSYLVGTTPNRFPANPVPPVYAQDNDFIKSNVDTATARINYRFAPNLKLTSLTRYGQSDNGYVTTGASFNATAQRAAIDGGHTGWQEVKYFAHQDNLRWDKEIGGLKHEFIFSFEYTDHKVKSGNYGITTTGTPNCRTSATATANNGFCITDASGAALPNIGGLSGRTYTQQGMTRDWRVKTFALSAMDTVDLTDKWTVFGGVRADHYRLSLDTYANTGASAGSQTAAYGFNDTLVNGHLGVSYKINPMGMVYAAYGTAQNINGGEPDTGTSAGYGGLVVYNGSAAGAKPVTSQNIELGTKWNLLDDKLLATAAVFQTTKSNVMEGATGLDYDAAGVFNTGKNRVHGIEFGLAGNVTKNFQMQAGVAIMKSKILDSFNPSLVGHPLANFANRSAAVQGKYQFTRDFAFGAVARFESGRCGGQPNTGADFNAQGYCSQPVPSFSVYDLFATYRINKHADLRLNVLNVTNKDYYTAVYRSGAFLYKGDGRAVRLTLNLDL
ncbi:MAG: TonB-dependent receptor [Acidovorax sp.]